MLVASSIVALAAAGLVGVMWNDRAEKICREETPAASGVTWAWDEFAYVCDIRAAGEQRKRVGIIDAFHSGGGQRHRPDR